MTNVCLSTSKWYPLKDLRFNLYIYYIIPSLISGSAFIHLWQRISDRKPFAATAKMWQHRQRQQRMKEAYFLFLYVDPRLELHILILALLVLLVLR